MKSEPVLFQYGILDEQSDIRAHVSVANQAIYVFKTANGVEAVKEKTKADLLKAYQPGVDGETATGWAVPVSEIKDIRKVDLSFLTWPKYNAAAMNTSQKGALAVRIVVDALKRGNFPLWIESQENTDASIQINGTDIVLAFSKRIQVKCDWRGGEKPKGTGNLFLQFAERNPLGAK